MAMVHMSLGDWVDAVELANTSRKVSVGCFDEAVVMTIHEAVRMRHPIITFDNIPEEGEKYVPVRVIKENGSPAISSGGQMIKQSRKLDSQWSRPELSLTLNQIKIQSLTPLALAARDHGVVGVAVTRCENRFRPLPELGSHCGILFTVSAQQSHEDLVLFRSLIHHGSMEFPPSGLLERR